MLNMFKRKPLIDETSSQWILDAFDWALNHFDNDFFTQKSQLVLPTNQFFPAHANSVEQMADNVFDQVSKLCGMNSWPFELVDPRVYQPQQYNITQPDKIVRSDDPSQLPMLLQNPDQKFVVSYDPIQIKQPQVMVANYASIMASYLMGVANVAPPGGEDYRAPATEILAIFMGFGVMFVNTAYAFRGGCGSCHVHAANRTAVLSENEALYALALFCSLKKIETKSVTIHLKKHLRPLYKHAVRDIKSQSPELLELQV